MKRRHLFFAAVFAALLGGCTTLMPSSDEHSLGDASWKSYTEAEKFYAQIKVGQSTILDVSKLGLDLKNSKNVLVLDRTSLLALFLANVPGSLEYIDPAVKGCLKPGENCTPYVFRKEESREEGKGSLVLRLLNFKKESTIRGWSVEMLILAHNNVVVYKQIKGTPNGTERNKEEKHPLGPFDGAMRSFIR